MALAMPPPASPTGAGSLVKKFQLTDVAAVIDEVAENEKQDRDGDEGAEAGHGQHEMADKFAPAETVAHACPIPLPRWDVTTISRRARPLRMKGQEEEHQAEFDQRLEIESPVASVNSLAITAAME